MKSIISLTGYLLVGVFIVYSSGKTPAKTNSFPKTTYTENDTVSLAESNAIKFTGDSVKISLSDK